jgi:TIR domain
MQPRIFISYRREDSPGSAGRLYDRLAEEFPKENLFMDVDAIAPGVDFIAEIERSVSSCNVLLAIIGRNWVTAKDAQGKRRLDDPADFVRQEIATALKSGVRVIPVLVDGAALPTLADLPDDLQALLRRNSVVLSHQHFTAETRALARTLASDAASDTPRPWRASDVAAQSAASAPAVGVDHAAQPLPVSAARIVGACATVFVIIASGAIAGKFLAHAGDEFWFLRLGPFGKLWVSFNLMIGPALALKLWLPRLGPPQFWGIVGATFGALVTLVLLQTGLQTTLFAKIAGNSSGIATLLLHMALVDMPAALGAGLVLGYFLAQALRGWFPNDGGHGFVARMILIWMETGTIYSVATFIVISIGEAAAPRAAGSAPIVSGSEVMRLWTDTLVFGASWALGLLLTLRRAPRPPLHRSS